MNDYTQFRACRIQGWIARYASQVMASLHKLDPRNLIKRPHVEAQMTEIDRALLKWVKSSATTGGNCVEVAVVGDMLLVRDSKDPKGPILRFTAKAWTAFLRDIPERPEASC